jgi:NAD(P)H-hydrate epimerase
MTEPLPETLQGTLALAALEQGRIGALLATRTVLAIGPGVTQNAETAELVRRLVAQADRPLVLDADGLNAFAGQRDALCAGAAGAVLTPHPGEMSRLFGVSTAEVQAHRRAYAQRLAQETGAIVVLKGHRTLIAGPDGRLYVNTTGNPGMATGGTGDVLTGMVAGLIAQFPHQDRLQVVAAAVYLHGLAGDEAALVRGEAGLLAGDLIECLSRAAARTASDSLELPRQWSAVRASRPQA